MGNLGDNDTFTNDILDNGGDQISITVGTSAVEGVITGGVPRSNRKYVIFQSQGQGVFFGFTAGVTTSNGIEIFKSQLLMIPVGENTSIYFIATSAGKEVRFQELS